ncbi:MAG: DUF4136 domain-containing protein [Gammaproteobacteria bacterium]|nr:DUF4136 domain-containing protein [Gammaproteobacteria bacterium]
MNPLKLSAATLAMLLLAACSGMEIEAWEPNQFAAGHYQSYSWRSEPIVNTVGSRDIIYQMDPIMRRETDRALQAKGYRKVEWNGDFTVDYIYAPGLRMGVPGAAASNISPRAGVRPNATMSQAQRDNAIALAGIKETHNLALQFNDGKSRMEVWRGVLTKIAQDVTGDNMDSTGRTIGKGINKLTSTLPDAG